MTRQKKEPTPYYGNVSIYNGREAYSSFGTNLEKMIEYAETLGHGIIRIEEAHAEKPPVWVRKAET